MVGVPPSGGDLCEKSAQSRVSSKMPRNKSRRVRRGYLTPPSPDRSLPAPDEAPAPGDFGRAGVLNAIDLARAAALA
jgi:hypothetical protein